VMGTHGRGLLQAPFIVLRGAQMSAVLVEVGFVSNKTDCALLADPTVRQDIARALTSAILEHLANDSSQAARQ
jgi:N-acetylmuramoyl-L-alanine amidase